MRQVAVTLALSLAVAGCGSPSGSAMSRMAFDLGFENCPVELWISGVVTPGHGGMAAIRNDQGVVYDLVWGTHNTGVVDWGQRYRIGGRWFSGVETFWACGGADAVIPE